MADTSLLLTDADRNRFPKFYLASFAAWLGSVAIGSTLGYSAVAIPTLEESSDIHFTKDLESWLGSLVTLGALLGSAVAGTSIELIGRKGTLMVTSVPFVLGWLMMTYAGNFSSVQILLVGRFITGISCGLISLTAPVYISETAAPDKRGFLGSGFQLSVTFGIFITYFIGKYITWSWLAGQCCLYPIAMLLAMYMMPESPAWLIKRGKVSEATEACLFLFGNIGAGDATVSVPPIVADGLSTEETEDRFRWHDVVKPNIYKPVLISLALMFFQQFTGVNAVIFYTTSIFKSTGTSMMSPIDATITVAVVQVFGTFIACLLTDRAGRRLLLIISGAGCVISLVMMSSFYFLTDREGDSFRTNFGFLPIVSLMFFITSFSLGQGPIPWLIMGEILPVNVKGMASGLSSSFNWLCAFLVTKNFDLFVNLMHESGAYLMFAVISIFGCVFVFLFLPETKGKSLQEIENHFRGL